PYAMTSTLAQMLFATGHQGLDLRCNIVATVVNVACNLVLLPRIGFVGAAVAALVAALVQCGLEYVYVRRRLPAATEPPRLARTAAVAAVALVAVLAFQRSPVVGVAVAMLVYVAGLGLTGVLERSHVADAAAL